MESLTTYLSSNISDPMRKDHVFVIIKPGFYNLSSELFKIFTEHGYTTVKSKTKRLTLEEAKSLYKVHKKEDFYNDLCKYMSSDIQWHSYSRRNQIIYLRSLQSSKMRLEKSMESLI